jgi:hypothetical protein
VQSVSRSSRHEGRERSDLQTATFIAAEGLAPSELNLVFSISAQDAFAREAVAG